MNERLIQSEIDRLYNQRKEYKSSIVELVKNILGLDDNDRLLYIDDCLSNYEPYFMLDIDEYSDYRILSDIFIIDDSCDKHIKIFDLK